LGKHSVAVVQYTFTNKQYTEKHNSLTVYKEKFAVDSEIQTKHMNALWAENRISEC